MVWTHKRDRSVSGCAMSGPVVSGPASAIVPCPGSRRPDAGKEAVVAAVLDQALHVERHFPQMIVTPHAGFAIGGTATLRYMVPAVGAVVDRVQQQALMVGS